MVQMVHLRMIDRGGREGKINVIEMVHVRRRGRSGGQIGAVETVHVRRMRREGEKGEEDKRLWLKEECEKNKGRGEEGGGEVKYVRWRGSM